MSDTEISTVSDHDTTPPPPMQEPPPQPNPTAASFTIWPPSQRTRDAVINRLIATLSTPSVLSKRYGTLSSDEAADVARQIEDEAFVAAAAADEKDQDGVEILHAYSKEISKRMLDTVKTRAQPASATGDGGASDVTATADDGVVAGAVSDS
ncbi:hypothetical protein RIF29_05954 [Crotalaria pallida]|uniref:WPP domain-containing protein n=1 Tax=Crotalaria pallida TaxID=3830 RepID=A0AAN9PAZ0_CROPI